MPYKSKAQAAFFNTHKAELEKEGVDVGHWNKVSKGKKLPKRVDKSRKNMAAVLDRITRLQVINDKIDTVCLGYDDDEEKGRQSSQISPVKAGVLGAGAAGGLYGIGSMAKSPAIGAFKSGGLGLTAGQTIDKAAGQVRNIGKGGLTEAARTIATGASVAGSTAKKAGSSMLAKVLARAKGVISPVAHALSERHAHLINLNSKMDKVVEMDIPPGRGPAGVDPSRGQFGGTDPGIMGQIEKDNKDSSARQRLKLKVNRLKSMGLLK